MRSTSFIRKFFITILSIDYIIGFLPTLLVYYISRFIVKPRSDTENLSRMLHTQAIVCPIVFAVFLMVLWHYVNLNLIIIYVVMVIYAFLFGEVHYKNDQFVSIVNLDEPIRTEKLSKRLRIIKVLTFYITVFILATLFPRE